jgi:hypothetical protein
MNLQQSEFDKAKKELDCIRDLSCKKEIMIQRASSLIAELNMKIRYRRLVATCFKAWQSGVRLQQLEEKKEKRAQTWCGPTEAFDHHIISSSLHVQLASIMSVQEILDLIDTESNHHLYKKFAPSSHQTRVHVVQRSRAVSCD